MHSEKKSYFFFDSFCNAVHYMGTMKLKRPKTTPMMVRLEDELEARLRRAAKTMGSNKSAVFRFALLNELPRIERGQINIPAL